MGSERFGGPWPRRSGLVELHCPAFAFETNSVHARIQERNLRVNASCKMVEGSRPTQIDEVVARSARTVPCWQRVAGPSER